MTVLASKEFWVMAGERAVKTAAQFGVGLFGLNAVGVIAFETTRWASIPLAMVTGAVFSILTSLASVGLSPENNPSVVRTPALDPENPPIPLPPAQSPAPKVPDPPV